MIRRPKKGWRQHIWVFAEKNPIVFLGYLLLAAVLLIVFAPEVKYVFTYYTHIPLSQDAKNQGMIMQKLDLSAQHGKRMDTVVSDLKEIKPKVVHLDSVGDLVLDLIRSTPTGKKMVHEYKGILQERRTLSLLGMEQPIHVPPHM